MSINECVSISAVYKGVMSCQYSLEDFQQFVVQQRSLSPERRVISEQNERALTERILVELVAVFGKMTLSQFDSFLEKSRILPIDCRLMDASLESKVIDEIWRAIKRKDDDAHSLAVKSADTTGLVRDAGSLMYDNKTDLVMQPATLWNYMKKSETSPSLFGGGAL